MCPVTLVELDDGSEIIELDTRREVKIQFRPASRANPDAAAAALAGSPSPWRYIDDQSYSSLQNFDAPEKLAARGRRVFRQIDARLQREHVGQPHHAR